MSYAYDLSRGLPHHPDQVWRALTEPALLSRWFMRCDQDLTSLPIGGRFTLTDPNAKGWSGILDGELVERIAPARLVLHHAGWRGLRGFLTAQFLRMGWRDLIAKDLNDLLAGTEHGTDSA